MYKRHALKYHPDKKNCQTNEAKDDEKNYDDETKDHAEIFKVIVLQYETLEKHIKLKVKQEQEEEKRRKKEEEDRAFDQYWETLESTSESDSDVAPLDDKYIIKGKRQKKMNTKEDNALNDIKTKREMYAARRRTPATAGTTAGRTTTTSSAAGTTAGRTTATSAATKTTAGRTTATAAATGTTANREKRSESPKKKSGTQNASPTENSKDETDADPDSEELPLSQFKSQLPRTKTTNGKLFGAEEEDFEGEVEHEDEEGKKEEHGKGKKGESTGEGEKEEDEKEKKEENGKGKEGESTGEGDQEKDKGGEDGGENEVGEKDKGGEDGGEEEEPKGEEEHEDEEEKKEENGKGKEGESTGEGDQENHKGGEDGGENDVPSWFPPGCVGLRAKKADFSLEDFTASETGWAASKNLCSEGVKAVMLEGFAEMVCEDLEWEYPDLARGDEKARIDKALVDSPSKLDDVFRWIK